MSLENINLEAIVEMSAVEPGPVYVYSVNNEGVHLRKKFASDFTTWVVTHNHFDNLTVIVTGAVPSKNAGDYTRLHYIADYVKPPLSQESEVSSGE